MNKNILLFICAAVIIVGVGSLVLARNRESIAQPAPSQKSDTATQPQQVESVFIKDFSFSPNTTRIKKGASVTFTNYDKIGHSATSDDDTFDTGMLEENESKTIEFPTEGTYSYYCKPHPNMKGTIIVE